MAVRPKTWRRVHRPLAALGLIQTAVTVLAAILLVVLSTWALTVLADIAIDMVSGRAAALVIPYPIFANIGYW